MKLSPTVFVVDDEEPIRSVAWLTETRSRHLDNKFDARWNLKPAFMDDVARG